MPITYDPATNILALNDYPEGSPCDFLALYNADKAGTLSLVDRDGVTGVDGAPVANTRNLRPADYRLLGGTANDLYIVVENWAGFTDATIRLIGTDEGDNAITEDLVVTGNGTYNASDLFKTLTQTQVTAVTGAGSFDYELLQGQWGVMWKTGDAQFKFDSKLKIGNNVDTTYLVDTNKQIEFSTATVTANGQIVVEVMHNGRFRLGAVISEGDKTSQNGCEIVGPGGSYWYYFISRGWWRTGYANFYSCSVRTNGAQGIVNVDTAWHCLFGSKVDGIQPTADVDVYDVMLIDTLYGTRLATGTFDKLTVLKGTSVIRNYGTPAGDRSVSNIYARHVTYVFKCATVTSPTNFYLVNVDSDTWAFLWDTSPQYALVYRQYEFDLLVVDEFGIPIGGVLVEIWDLGGNLVVTDTTVGGGPYRSLKYDGWLRGHAYLYADAHDAPSCSYMYDDTPTLILGQDKYGGYYDVNRVGLYFDTSELGAGANIIAAKLHLFGSADHSDDDFDIAVVDGSVLETPLDCDDFGDLLGQTTVGGSMNTSGFSVYPNPANIIELNATGRGWINKIGVTKLALRSQKDIDNIAPTQSEYVWLHSREDGHEHPPILEVTCLVGSLTTGQIATKTLIYGTYQEADGDTPTMKTPHTIRLSKSGSDFLTYQKQFTADEKIDWRIAMADISDIIDDLDEIKGSGFDTIYHSLVVVKSRVDDANVHMSDVKGTGFVKDTHSLTDILASVATRALEATLSTMKGAGWTTETLKAIYDSVALTALETTVADLITRAKGLNEIHDDVADLITRAKGLNAIYDDVALRALETSVADLITRAKGLDEIYASVALRALEVSIADLITRAKGLDEIYAQIGALPAATDTKLSDTHGTGSWETFEKKPHVDV